MKFIKYSIIILAIALLAWMIPTLLNLAGGSKQRDSFVYYSSVAQSFIRTDFVNGKLVRKNDKTGKILSKSEVDSLLPMLYYRQLLSEGRMPDSILGYPVSMRHIRKKGVMFKQLPQKKNRPMIPIHTLFEAFSGRVELQFPDDVFRIDDKIEFIKTETNEVDEEKSARFMKSLLKAGFVFPATNAVGNPNIRKPYEEGYMITDSKGQIFHMKMVNGRPFVKNTNKPEGITPVHISTIETADRSIYAFVFDKNKKLYTITSDNYKYVEIPCPDYNIDRDKLTILGNMFFWNVIVSSEKGKESYALHTYTKEVVDKIKIDKEVKPTAISDYVLPFKITFRSKYTEFVNPKIKLGHWAVVIMNILLLIAYVLIRKRNEKKIQVSAMALIFLTGIYGFIANLFLNK